VGQGIVGMWYSGGGIDLMVCTLSTMRVSILDELDTSRMVVQVDPCIEERFIAIP
jgi:hypothetical protein